MSSDIFTEINKVNIDFSEEQVAELAKFKPEVISYVNSIAQNFINFDIFHRQCKQYSAKKDIPLNTELKNKIIKIIHQRRSKEKKVTRQEFFDNYNMLFNDKINDVKDVD